MSEPEMPELLPAGDGILLPDLEPIIAIHQGGDDSYVAFARKVDDDWQNLPMVPVRKLERMFPEFVSELMRDSYFSIDGYYRPDDMTAESKRYLNACWADIDLHGAGEIYTLGQRWGQVVDAIQNESIPRPSITMYSGRGLWLLWLLVGSDGIAPRAFPEKRMWQQAINRELAFRVQADKIAATAAMLRVPGSTNTKAEPGHEMVRYRMNFDVNTRGRGEYYSLEQLGKWLCVPEPRLKEQRRKANVRPEDSQRGLVGWKALWAHRYTLFSRLLEIRRVFREGGRNRAAYWYTVIMRGCNMDNPTIHRELTRFSKQHCRPALATREVWSAFNQGKHHTGKVRDAILSEQLQITLEEGEMIPEWSPATVQSEVEPADQHLRPNERIRFREQKMAEIIAQLGYMPSTRQMAAQLKKKGVCVSYVQVSRMYPKLRATFFSQAQSSIEI